MVSIPEIRAVEGGMRMRVGDIEMDSSEGITFGAAPPAKTPRPEVPAARPDVVQDIVAVPKPIFVVAAFLAVVAAIGIAVFALLEGRWLFLIPVPFLGRFAVYAAILGLQPASTRTGGLDLEARAKLLDALGGSSRSADEVARRLGWSQPRTLDMLVRLIDEGEVEEDLDIETGVWTYRRSVALDVREELTTLPARERLQAIVAAEPHRRKS